MCPVPAIRKETEAEVFGRGISKLLMMEWFNWIHFVFVLIENRDPVSSENCKIDS
jgi:hypothetical protein